MSLGVEPVFASGGPGWPLAGLPDGFEPDDPDLDIPHGAIRNGRREMPERHFTLHQDHRVTHTATEPLAPAKAATVGRKWKFSVIASCVFHAAIAGFFLYAVDEAVLMEGADFSGIAYLGAGEDQVKAGEVADEAEDAVEVTMVTMLQARPVETVEAEAVPVEDITKPLEMAEAVVAEPERLQPVSEQAIQKITETPAEAVTARQSETTPVETQLPVNPEVTRAEPVENQPVRTVTETVPETLATDRVEMVEDDNVVRKPAVVTSAEPVEAIEEVTATEPVQTVTAHQSETVEKAVTPTTEAARTRPSEAQKVETVEVAKAESPDTKPVRPLEEVKPEVKPRKTETQKQKEPVKEASRSPAADKPAATKKARTGEKAKPKRAGNGGKSEANTRRGQADGQEKGDSKQASRGGSKNGKVGNAAVSNYPGKVRSKLVRAARSVRAKGKGEVVVAFAVGSNGGVRSARVARSSGVASVDQAALQAIRKASPFPPIPESAGRSSWEFSVPLAFVR